jgi:uncharacterized RDD family membrane protein YckC
MRERPGGRRVTPAPARGGPNLIMAACVTLGCWGFAFSFTFLITDPNRYLYGGLAALLALMWTLLFFMRLRRRLQQG